MDWIVEHIAPLIDGFHWLLPFCFLGYSWDDFKDDVEDVGEEVVGYVSPVFDVFAGSGPISDLLGSGGSTATPPGGEALMAELPMIDYEAAVAAANAIAEANLERYPRVAKTAGNVTRNYTMAADRYMRDRYYRNLDYVYPGWRTNLATQTKNIAQVDAFSDELMTGQLPADVQSEIERNSAALGIERGLYGEAQTYGTARDIGQTSLDLMLLGSNIKSTQVAPMSVTAANTAKAFMPPVVDPTQVFLTTTGQITGVANVSPTAAMQASIQAQDANAQMVWNQQLSEMNRQMDIYQTEVNRDIAEQTARYNLFGDIIGGGASIIGGGMA